MLVGPWSRAVCNADAARRRVHRARRAGHANCCNFAGRRAPFVSVGPSRAPGGRRHRTWRAQARRRRWCDAAWVCDKLRWRAKPRCQAPPADDNRDSGRSSEVSEITLDDARNSFILRSQARLATLPTIVAVDAVTTRRFARRPFRRGTRTLYPNVRAPADIRVRANAGCGACVVFRRVVRISAARRTSSVPAAPGRHRRRCF